MHALEFMMPFTAESDDHTMAGCTALTVEIAPELLEARALKPRKVFTHCKLVARVIGYRRSSICCSTDVEAEDGIEKRLTTQNTVVLTHIAEKDFTFT